MPQRSGRDTTKKGGPVTRRTAFKQDDECRCYKNLCSDAIHGGEMVGSLVDRNRKRCLSLEPDR